MKRIVTGITLILLVMAMLVLTVSAEMVKAGMVTQEVHDLVVVGVAPTKTIVGQGFGLQVDVTVSNRGDYPEALNMTLYANATTIATFAGKTVLPKGSDTIDFSWNTASFALGNYTLGAVAEPVPGETDATNNYFTGGWVIVAIAGDLTGGTGDVWDFVPDGNVDLKDIAIFSWCFYSKPGDPRWNSNCDINNDGTVDSKDIAVLAKHVGEAQNPVSSFRIGVYTASWNFREIDAESLAYLYDMSQSWCSPDWPQHPGWDYTAKMNQVHAMNPKYKALMYRNCMSIYSYWTDEWNYANSKGWLLKGADGGYMTEGPWPKNYMVDITNPEYQQWLASKVKSWLEQYPYFDGVMADDSLMYSEASWEGAGNGVKPVNPRTGTYFTDLQILDGCAGMLNAIIDAIGASKLLMPNGIWNGAIWYNTWPGGDNLRYILSKVPRLNCLSSEGTFMATYNYWYSESLWKNSVDFVVWVQDNFLSGHPERCFSGECLTYALPPGATSEQVIKYGYCSMLLAAEYSSPQNTISFGFSQDFLPNSSLLQLLQTLRSADIIKPLGDYYKITSTAVYARDFVGGKVLVNPTNISYSITLDGSYETIDGAIVSGPLTVYAHSGVILLK